MDIKILNGNIVKVEYNDDNSYTVKGNVDIAAMEYKPATFIDLVRGVAEMKTIGLAYRFNGLPFCNKLATASVFYHLHLKWLDDYARSKGYHPDGVHKLHDVDPALMTEEKDAHWSRAALYAAHQAREAIGYDVPEFVTEDDIQWVKKYFGKVTGVDLQRIKTEAMETAKSTHKLGKLVARPGEKTLSDTLRRYATELYNAGRETAEENAAYVSEHLADIAWTMGDPEFSRLDFHYPADSLDEMIDDYIGDHVQKANNILGAAYVIAERASRSRSAKRAKEGRDLVQVIEQIQQYVMTDKAIADAEARAAEADDAFKDFDIEG